MDTRSSQGVFQNTPDNKNLMLTTRFKMEIKRLPNLTYFCQAVTLPGIGLTETIQATPFNPVIHSGGPVIQEKLNLTFLVDEGFKTWRELRNWILNCGDYTDFLEYKIPSEHLSDEVTVFLLSNNNIPRFKFTFLGTFPVALGGLILDSSNPEAQRLICTASFTYTSFKVDAL